MLAFHGTPEANIESILQHGMLPRCRRSLPVGDWFSPSPTYSACYCRSEAPLKVTLVLFLLLPLPSTVTYKKENVLVMGNEHYELPLCTVSFSYSMNDDSKAGLAALDCAR